MAIPSGNCHVSKRSMQHGMHGVQPLLREVPTPAAAPDNLLGLRKAGHQDAFGAMGMQPLRRSTPAPRKAQMQLVGKDVRYPLHVQHHRQPERPVASMPMAAQNAKSLSVRGGGFSAHFCRVTPTLKARTHQRSPVLRRMRAEPIPVHAPLPGFPSQITGAIAAM